METLRYTLICDGSSDRCLRAIIDWTLDQLPATSSLSIEGSLADLRTLCRPPSQLPDRIRQALELYPCDIVFIHRDAENEPMAQRIAEIASAATESQVGPHVPVVPVRMTEAWLLIDKSAIRRAAANPNGRMHLDMPQLNRLEGLPDPKAVLYSLLAEASGKAGRRLAQFKRDINGRVQRVAELIQDFSPLRQLGAFRAFEEATSNVVATLAAQAQPNPG